MCQCSARTCRAVRSTETHARSTREASYSSFRLSDSRKDNYANFHPVEMERLRQREQVERVTQYASGPDWRIASVPTTRPPSLPSSPCTAVPSLTYATSERIGCSGRLFAT